MPTTRIIAATLLAALSSTASAQTLLSGDHSISGRLCAGAGCTTPESFGTATQKLKDDDPLLYFEDTSAAADVPTNDWAIDVNDSAAFGADYFAIVDASNGRNILTLSAGAPSNAMFLDATGNLGLGTTMPQAPLHAVRGDSPGIRLEQDASGGWTPQIWELTGSDFHFAVNDITNAVHPLTITPGTDNNHALTIDPVGRVGLNVLFPSAQLHVWGDAGSARALIEETNATLAPRTLLEMKNNGRPEIVMANTGTNGEWSFGAGTNFVLKQGAVGTASSAKTKYLTLFAGSGNLEISGQIITGGPTCGSGCDAVFSADYDLPSVEQHAAAMYALGHLPNVGATAPGAPLNLSEKLGDMLNELEHAHIYIARQHDAMQGLEAQVSGLKSDKQILEQRLERLETVIKKLTLAKE